MERGRRKRGGGWTQKKVNVGELFSCFLRKAVEGN